MTVGTAYVCPVTLRDAGAVTFEQRYPRHGWCSECDGWHAWPGSAEH